MVTDDIQLPNIPLRTRYAKGTGDANAKLKLNGAFKATAGEKYDTFTGYTGIIVTESVGISINKSPMAYIPERTAIDVSTTGLILVFDKSIMILTTT